MIEIPRQHEPPHERGSYLAVLTGTPLPVVLAWTEYGWMRGATKIASVSHYLGPIEIERRRGNALSDR